MRPMTIARRTSPRSCRRSPVLSAYSLRADRAGRRRLRGFRRWRAVELDFVNSVAPPKALFFPPRQTLFHIEGTRTPALQRRRPGSRSPSSACAPATQRALAFLDRFFAGRGFEDETVVSRIRPSLMMTLACRHAGPGLFLRLLRGWAVAHHRIRHPVHRPRRRACWPTSRPPRATRRSQARPRSSGPPGPGDLESRSRQVGEDGRAVRAAFVHRGRHQAHLARQGPAGEVGTVGRGLPGLRRLLLRVPDLLVLHRAGPAGPRRRTVRPRARRGTPASTRVSRARPRATTRGPRRPSG